MTDKPSQETFSGLTVGPDGAEAQVPDERGGRFHSCSVVLVAEGPLLPTLPSPVAQPLLAVLFLQVCSFGEPGVWVPSTCLQGSPEHRIGSPSCARHSQNTNAWPCPEVGHKCTPASLLPHRPCVLLACLPLQACTGPHFCPPF